MDVLLSVMPDSAANAEERAHLTMRLRAELRELHVCTLETLTQDTVPEHSKGGGTVAAGAVVLALSAPGGVLTSLIGLVQDWLGRQGARHRVSITIDGDTIEVEATSEERRQLIDAFVRRHSARGE
jgi:hypothetical protein